MCCAVLAAIFCSIVLIENGENGNNNDQRMEELELSSLSEKKISSGSLMDSQRQSMYANVNWKVSYYSTQSSSFKV